MIIIIITIMIIKENVKALWLLFELCTLRVIKPVKKGKTIM